MKTQDRSHWYFTGPFLVFLVLLVLQGFRMAQGAANGVDQVPKVISRTAAGDSLYIKGDTLYMNQMTVSLAAVLKAVAVQTDTVRGSATYVSILDDTVRIDPDSSGSLVTITFGGYGGGIRWNRSNDKMQFTNDFSTWTDIGSGTGGGTGDIDAVTAGNGLSGGGTSGSVTLDVRTGWGLTLDNDSVKVNAAQVASADSNAQEYATNGIIEYLAGGGIRLGPAGGPTLLRIDLTEDNIKSYVAVFFGEAIADSAVASWHRITTAIGDSVAGTISSVSSTDPIIGGASTGDVSLSFNWIWLRNFIDSCTATIPHAELADSTNGGAARAELAKAVLYSWIYTTIDTSQATVLSVAFGNGGTGGGSNGALTLNVVAGTSTGLAVNADSVFISAGGITATQLASDAVTEAKLKAVDTPADEEFLTYESTTGDFEWQGEVGDISNVGVTAPITGGGSSGSVTIAFDWQWLWGFVDTTTATLPHATLADSCTKYDTTFVDWTELRAEIKNRAEIYNKIDTTSAKIPFASKADTSLLVLAPQGSASTFGRLTGDSLIADTLFATRGNFTNLKIGSDAFITDITGDGLAMSGSALTATLGTAITSSEITDQTIATADIDSTDDFAMSKLRVYQQIYCNQIETESTGVSISIGSGAAGLTISSAVTIGSDITDDTVVVDYYPEYQGMVLRNDIFSTFKDSMKMYAESDSLYQYGNVIVISDSTLTTGLHRRGFDVIIAHPLRVDSLRYVEIQALCKDSSGTNRFSVTALLRTTPWTLSCVDSLAAGNLKDYKTISGDYADSAGYRNIRVTGGAVTAGGRWYLQIRAKRETGSVWQWAKIGRIHCVYSRTAL